MIEFEITAGRLTSLSRLLVFMAGNPNIDATIASEYLVRTRAIQSAVIAQNAIDWAFKLSLIEFHEGLKLLSSTGESIVMGAQDSTGLGLQRRLLLKAIVQSRRDLLWIAFAEPEELKVVMPSLFQILLELKLIERKPSDEASEFWQDLRRAEVRFNEALLKKIGDTAEAKSMKYETERLASERHGDLANQIVWLSRESDLHGYDILSFKGHGPNPKERRHIEVKRAKVVGANRVQFYFSRNEYTQARALAEKYILHIWWAEPDSTEMKLEVVQGSKIIELVPENKNDDNYWTECVLTFEIYEPNPDRQGD